MKKVLTLLLFITSFTAFSQTKQYEGEEDGFVQYRSLNEEGQLIESGTFWDGKKDGYWYSYHSNGKISAVAQFSENKRVGTWRFYDVDGNLKAKVKYKDNRRVSAVLMKDFDNG